MKNKVLTLILAVSLPLVMMAQGGITEPGATEPNSLATTTYDNPGGPNRAGANRAPMDDDDWLNPADPGDGDEGSPIGAPWILLGFAAAYAGYRLVRRKGVKD